MDARKQSEEDKIYFLRKQVQAEALMKRLDIAMQGIEKREQFDEDLDARMEAEKENKRKQLQIEQRLRMKERLEFAMNDISRRNSSEKALKREVAEAARMCRLPPQEAYSVAAKSRDPKVSDEYSGLESRGGRCCGRANFKVGGQHSQDYT